MKPKNLEDDCPYLTFGNGPPKGHSIWFAAYQTATFSCQILPLTFLERSLKRDLGVTTYYSVLKQMQSGATLLLMELNQRPISDSLPTKLNNTLSNAGSKLWRKEYTSNGSGAWILRLLRYLLLVLKYLPGILPFGDSLLVNV